MSWVPVPQGLFRTAQQKKPAEFLGRAFTSEKDRAAAAKNAFVLLAQHKPQMAAAFFILGDCCRHIDVTDILPRGDEFMQFLHSQHGAAAGRVITPSGLLIMQAPGHCTFHRIFVGSLFTCMLSCLPL